MTDTPTMGHNNPPTPMEVCADLHSDIISEAENWSDGDPVETEEQMKAVDAIIKGMKSYRSTLKSAVEEYRRPFIDANAASIAAAKVYTDDADRLQAALVSSVDAFKKKLAAEKEAVRRAAWEAARAAEREAEAIAAKANASSIEDARAVEAAKQAALNAEKAARFAQNDTVKGMRTVTRHEVVSLRDLVNWIATHDKPAMAAFAESYAEKNHKDIPDAIVRTWTEKESF